MCLGLIRFLGGRGAEVPPQLHPGRAPCAAVLRQTYGKTCRRLRHTREILSTVPERSRLVQHRTGLDQNQTFLEDCRPVRHHHHWLESHVSPNGKFYTSAGDFGKIVLLGSTITLHDLVPSTCKQGSSGSVWSKHPLINSRTTGAVILSAVFRPAKRDESKGRTSAFRATLHMISAQIHTGSASANLPGVWGRYRPECMGPSSGALRAAKDSAPQG